MNKIYRDSNNRIAIVTFTSRKELANMIKQGSIVRNAFYLPENEFTDEQEKIVLEYSKIAPKLTEKEENELKEVYKNLGKQRRNS
jgi:hypothetical protein